MRKCSVQRSVRTPISPPYFTTMRSKLVQGTKSITCENRVRPEYMAAPRLKNQNRVRSYRRNPNRGQVDTKKNAQETLMLQRYFTKSPSLNRTAVVSIWDAARMRTLVREGQSVDKPAVPS